MEISHAFCSHYAFWLCFSIKYTAWIARLFASNSQVISHSFIDEVRSVLILRYSTFFAVSWEFLDFLLTKSVVTSNCVKRKLLHVLDFMCKTLVISTLQSCTPVLYCILQVWKFILVLSCIVNSGALSEYFSSTRSLASLLAMLVFSFAGIQGMLLFKLFSQAAGNSSVLLSLHGFFFSVAANTPALTCFPLCSAFQVYPLISRQVSLSWTTFLF